MDIGEKIKAIRLTRDLTQEELACRCELTKGYISQLENNICSPSIATLQDILSVLGVDLSTFFTEIKNVKIVFSKPDFFESENGDGLSTWLIPNSQKNEMEPIILTLPEGGASTNRFPFEGEEFGYVLEGRIEIVTAHTNHMAKKGEAFYLNGDTEHKIVNAGASRARIVWVTTPSNF
ncbi:MAG: helix-turn-helix domain-containing protein [Christensenellaceae bacterium]|jgi:transcriptional regulator with XRE-family HTH domain|nr:helix-turn-helix domain-containing protein [Christensenellaceae bacterium]